MNRTELPLTDVQKEEVVMDAPDRSRGFSLIELLAVIAIIAISSAIVIPRGIDYVRNYEVISAAQSVASQMQFTRAQAVRRNARRGLILNFDYPTPGQFQFTTLDEDPRNGGYGGANDNIFTENPGEFDPNNRITYGVAPDPPYNTDPTNEGDPSPHGTVFTLPTQMQFAPGTYTSLLFRTDGSVEAVSAVNGGNPVVNQNNLDWQVQIINNQNQLTRTITISRNGRVIVSNP
jgi:prepilin-type N-terminal cleavage/methylation domain-containing protein